MLTKEDIATIAAVEAGFTALIVAIGDEHPALAGRVRANLSALSQGCTEDIKPMADKLDRWIQLLEARAPTN